MQRKKKTISEISQRIPPPNTREEIYSSSLLLFSKRFTRSQQLVILPQVSRIVIGREKKTRKCFTKLLAFYYVCSSLYLDIFRSSSIWFMLTLKIASPPLFPIFFFNLPGIIWQPSWMYLIFVENIWKIQK